MIRLLQSELEDMVIMDKQMLVQCKPMNEEVGASKMYVDTTYEPELHMAMHGTVTKLSIDPVSTEIGDEVFFHFLEIKYCQDDGRCYYTTDTKQTYWQIGEEKMYMYVRGEVLTMLNNWLLVEAVPIELKTGKNGLLLNALDVQKNKHEPHEGIVRAIPVDSEFKSGMRINFMNNRDVPMEFDGHESLKKGVKYFRIKENAVLAELTDYYKLHKV